MWRGDALQPLPDQGSRPGGVGPSGAGARFGSLPLAGLASQEFAAGAAQLLGLSARWCAAHRDLLPAYLRFCFLDMQSPEAAMEGWAVGALRTDDRQ